MMQSTNAQHFLQDHDDDRTRKHSSGSSINPDVEGRK